MAPGFFGSRAAPDFTLGFWGWAINLQVLAKANIVRGGTPRTLKGVRQDCRVLTIGIL